MLRDNYSYHHCYYYYYHHHLNHYNGYTKGYRGLLYLLSFLLYRTIHTTLLLSSTSQQTMSTKATHVDIYPMETLSSMVVVKRRDNEADYQHDSKSNRDEVELAHFGKRQQLKVSILDRRTISLFDNALC